MHWPDQFNPPHVAPPPASGAAAQATPAAPTVHRDARDQVLPVPPAYRFDQVEVIGFRLNLIELGVPPADVATLLRCFVKPLNFHLDRPGGVSSGIPQDFSYAAASSTLVLELLRYPRMRLGEQEIGGYQCQHELALRLLVGRLDDASAQAHDPAYHVPAIFVDNVWSKVLGRELQGFDKQLAAFCTEYGQPLRCDGRRNALGDIVPLQRIKSVRLVPEIVGGGGGGSGAKGSGGQLLSIDGLDASTPSPAPTLVDQALLLDSFRLAGLGWRPFDFDAKEFRRAFARDMIGTRLRGFRSIQVVDKGLPLQPTWIGARFEFDQVQLNSIRSMVTLRFGVPDSPLVPPAWRMLTRLLKPGIPVALSADDCYRIRCNITLRVDDGLAW